MLKMFVVGLISFLLTIAVGIGLGFGFLSITNQGGSFLPPQLAGVVATPTPIPTATPAPSPTPTAAPEVDKTELSILVVNATTKAGYAGTYTAKLDDAEYGTVKAANAKGDYDAGFYILTDDDTAEGVVEAVSKDTGLTLTEENTKQTEDPQGTYDAVIVLAK